VDEQREATRLLAPIGLAAGVVALVVGAAPAGARLADPPGNNGTVKVDEAPFDDHPDNEPHVGCVFQIDLYGYDEGDLSAGVVFEAVAPTGDAELLTGELDIGDDAAGGGTDLDATATYDLTAALAAITPHPQQGWHVRLTLHAEGSRGADVKHKVFWIEGCGPPGTPTTSTTRPHGSTTTVPDSTTTTTPGPSTPPGPPGSTPPTTGPGGPGSPGGPTSTAPDVTAPTTAPPAPSTSVVSGTLPRTGSETTPLVAAGLLLVAVGAATLVALRMRRT
jgi:LPXTG-motif cell wall-anchored protein